MRTCMRGAVLSICIALFSVFCVPHAGAQSNVYLLGKSVYTTYLFPFEATAALLGISPGTVGVHLHRALGTLRTHVPSFLD